MSRPWSTSEARTLHRMRSQRVPVRDIGLVIGRTSDAIYAFLRYQHGTSRAPSRSVPGQTPSDRLRIATVRAILKHAQASGLDLKTAAQRLLSEGRC